MPSRLRIMANVGQLAVRVEAGATRPRKWRQAGFFLCYAQCPNLFSGATRAPVLRTRCAPRCCALSLDFSHRRPELAQ